MTDIKRLYDARFNTIERVRKNELWAILCKNFLVQFIKSTDTVVDLGAGYCEFINNIHAKRRIAVDIKNDVKESAQTGVEIVVGSTKNIRRLFQPNSIDIIFISNLLEHLESKEEVFRLLYESYDNLRKGGRLLIMQPDISLVGHEYWDFFDHKVPLTTASLQEVLVSIGYSIHYLRSPFLPYTTKTKYLPTWPWLFKLYLKIGALHYLFGKQFFVCAQK